MEQAQAINGAAPDLLIRKSYWLRQFAQELPQNGLIHERKIGMHEPGIEVRSFPVPDCVLDYLSQLAPDSLISKYLVCVGAMLVVLRKHTREQRFILGLPSLTTQTAKNPANIPFPVQVNVEDEGTFRELLIRLREEVLQAYNHAVPSLVELLAKTGFPFCNQSPIFPIMVEMAGLHETCDLLNLHGDLQFRFFADRPGVDVAYRSDLYDCSSVECLVEHWGHVLASTAPHPEIALNKIIIANEKEMNRVIRDFNCTECPYDLRFSAWDRFESQARRNPGHTATVEKSGNITYGELLGRSCQCSKVLRDANASPGQIVGLLLPRGSWLLAGALSALANHLVFVLIDPDLPVDRVLYLLRDSCAAFLGFSSSMAEKFGSYLNELPSLQIAFVLDSASEPMVQYRRAEAPQPGGMLACMADPECAYLVYTSGSTGMPKGALVRHQGMLNHILAQADALKLDSSMRFLQSATASSDIVIWQLLAPVVLGGKTIFMDKESVLDSAELFQALKSHRITLAELVPASLEAMLYYVNELQPAERSLPDLASMLVTGEAVTVKTVNSWFKLFPEIKLVNCYGPAEASDDVCQLIMTEPLPFDQARVQIGSPLANVVIYVLDENSQPAPFYVPGEICIGGIGVGAGYWRDQARTKAAFIADTISGKPGQLYRSGDLGRWLPDGNLEFLGRIDQQIKIRGNRVEPGEIESILCSDPTVNQAVVTAWEVEGQKELVAYIVVAELSDSEDTENCENDHVMHWRTVFEDTYARPSRQLDPSFNIIGWNSTYSGLPITPAEMQEWVDGTVERIAKLQPDRVAEIGCGTGMLLLRLAAQCTRYWASDLVPGAVNYVQRHLEEFGISPDRVTLKVSVADDFSSLGEEKFDTIILNSVVQYFPSVEYLARVLKELTAHVTPGGAIFIGDVRSLPLLEGFYATLELQRAPAAMTKPEFKRRVEDRMAREEELVIHPCLFSRLAIMCPNIETVSISPRRGSHRNELTKFRYDVILHIADSKKSAGKEQRQVVTLDPTSLCDRDVLVHAADAGMTIREVPNVRLIQENRLCGLLKQEDGPTTVGALREEMEKVDVKGADPETLWNLASELELDLNLSWTAGRHDGSFDIVFGSPDLMPAGSNECTTQSFAKLGNQPLNGRFFARIVPRLRQSLMEKLPNYMVPSYFHRVETLPLSQAGKVDRSALPAPDQMNRGSEQGAFVPPRTRTETVIAATWRELLGLRRVGVEDNFFELGGHSLLAAQVITRLRKAFPVDIKLRDLFEFPSVAGLASQIDGRSNVTDKKNSLVKQTPNQQEENATEQAAPVIL